MSPGVKKAKKRRAAQRRAEKQADRKCESRQRPYMAWKHLTRNQKEVAKRLLDGEVTMISSASWVFFERFLVFLHEAGFFEVIGVEGKQF